MVQKTERIISRDNSRLVAARKTRDGKDPERIFIEGRRLVEEALRSEIDIEEVFVADGFRSDGLIERLGEHGYSLVELSEKLFATIADTHSPQGIVGIAKRPYSTAQTFARKHLTLFLKEINNPSNLGAILRTAEAAGVVQIIVSTGSTDVFSAKSLRASMGSAFRLQIWENAKFDEVLDWAAANEIISTASDISGSQSFLELDWTKPRLIIFGSEAHGLTESELGRIQDKMLIPMENGVESLNLAVAAGIILFEAKRYQN